MAAALGSPHVKKGAAQRTGESAPKVRQIIRSVVTQHDLARVAGVSPTTIYNALHRPQLVCKRTLDRIYALIREHDYMPNDVARSMVRKKTDVLGIVVPVLEVLYHARLVSAIERAASAAGYTCMICQHSDDPLKEEREVMLMRQRKVDGMIIHNCGQATDSRAMQRLKASGVPFVLVGGRVDGMDDYFVGGDDRRMAAEAVEWLIGQGHRRIATITWYRTPGDYHAGPRYLGYEDALKRHGIALDPALVEMAQTEYRSGRLEILNILRRTSSDRPTAVLAFNDPTAFSVMAGLREAGLRVPADVTVVSFGGCFDETMLEHQLPAVVEPLDEIARCACEMLLGQIERKPYAKGPILVPGRFHPVSDVSVVTVSGVS
ncbi:MAG: LacI family transcriptional regulator [Verrucomicrobia bacterium]|nr:LacI family transcriptional regulator [Verrucomicrobiota bacterium]